MKLGEYKNNIPKFSRNLFIYINQLQQKLVVVVMAFNHTTNENKYIVNIGSKNTNTLYYQLMQPNLYTVGNEIPLYIDYSLKLAATVTFKVQSREKLCGYLVLV